MNKLISLNFENDVISAMITMFSELSTIANNRSIEIVDDGKGILLRDKSKEEIINLNFDYSSLKNKIFDWFKSGHEWLHLDSEESENFRKCSYAAYYYIYESLSANQLKLNHFVKFHEKYFKTN